MKDYYVYVYLDPRKPGNFEYNGLHFTFEPFYVGKGKGGRCFNGLRDKKLCRKVSRINSIIKDGKFPQILKINENLTNKESQDIEKKTIKAIGRIDSGLGPLTNMTDGGDGGSGMKHSDQWKKILSKPVLQYFQGEKIEEYTSIREASEKTGVIKQNISSALTGRYKSAGGFQWEYKSEGEKLQGHLKKPFSMPKHRESTKDKMSKSARKGEVHHMKNRIGGNHPKAKKVEQLSLDGTLLRIWDSLSDIYRELGFTPSNICRCCQGGVKKIGGFRWRYLV